MKAQAAGKDGEVPSSELEYSWGAFGGASLDLNKEGVTSTDRQSPSLVINAHQLAGGLSYTITLSVTRKSDKVTGDTTVVIRTVKSPTMGNFNITNTEGRQITQGVEMNTTFVMSATGWTVTAEDSKDVTIKQRFAYMNNGLEIPLSDFSSTPEMEVQLPRGTGSNHNIEIICVIQAEIRSGSTPKFSTTVLSKNISVAPKPVKTSELSAMVDDEITKMNKTADPWAALRMVNTIGAQLGGDSDSDTITAFSTTAAPTSNAAIDAKLQLRTKMLGMLESVAKDSSDSSASSIDQMVNTLATVTSEPKELTEEARNKSVALLKKLMENIKAAETSEPHVTQRLSKAFMNSLSNVMESPSKPTHTVDCKAQWKACYRETFHMRQCSDKRRLCLRARSKVQEDSDALVKKLVALEMKRQLPGEKPYQLKSKAMDIETSKVKAADLVNKDFKDRSGSSFKLPEAVLGKTKCKDKVGSSKCGVNIQIKSWDPKVHGCEASLPDEEAELEANNSTDTNTTAKSFSELSSGVTSMTVREDDDESTEVQVRDLDDTASGAVLFTMKIASLSADAQAAVDSGKFELKPPQCVWFDPNDQAFKKDGCQLVMWNNETNEVTCRCTHLTDFALYSQIEAIKTNIEACEAEYPDYWELDPAAPAADRLAQLRKDLILKNCVNITATAKAQCEEQYNKQSDFEEMETALCGATVSFAAISAALQVQIWVGIANYVLCFIVFVKLTRFTIPTIIKAKNFSDLTLKLNVADYQCLLVLISTLLRGTNSILKYLQRDEQENTSLNAPVIMMTMLFMFWGASLTVANWMTIIHHTVKKGSKSPISGIGPYYLAFNLVICAMITVDWIGLYNHTHQAGDTNNIWAMMGQLTLAIPELMLSISAVVYGIMLIRMIRASMAKFEGSEDMKHRQLVACRKTALIFVVFSMTFLLQAILDAVAGIDPKLYYSTAGDTLPVAPMDLAHATASVVVNLIIIFVVVKYEEVTQVAQEVATPFTMLAKQATVLLSNGYSKVPEDDDLDLSKSLKQRPASKPAGNL